MGYAIVVEYASCLEMCQNIAKHFTWTLYFIFCFFSSGQQVNFLLVIGVGKDFLHSDFEHVLFYSSLWEITKKLRNSCLESNHSTNLQGCQYKTYSFYRQLYKI